MNKKIKNRAKFLICILVCSITFPVCGVFANESNSSVANRLSFTGSGTVFKLSWLTDGLLLGTGVAVIGTELLLGKVVMPKSTSFDGKILDRNSVNSFDRWAMKPYSKPLDLTATGLELAAMLTPAFLFATQKSEWITVGAMYAETVMLAYGLKELGKVLINRSRPYMYFEGYPQKAIEDGDWLSSCPSGHTTMSFAGAVFTSYVFAKYFPDSAFKIPVIAGSMTIATSVAVLRVLSGNHFLSDVLVGAAIGGTVGFLVPFLHTLNRNPVNSNSDSSRSAFSSMAESNYNFATGDINQAGSFALGILSNGVIMRYAF